MKESELYRKRLLTERKKERCFKEWLVLIMVVCLFERILPSQSVIVVRVREREKGKKEENREK